MIILDTNVVSALMRNAPDVEVTQWLDQQPENSIWTTSVTVFEIQSGLQIMPAGKKRSALSDEFERLIEEIEHRVLPFDEEGARLAANLTADRQSSGRTGELRDIMIAGIVLARHGSLATRNVSHFADIRATVINPWASK
jgi:hypothetical protein